MHDPQAIRRPRGTESTARIFKAVEAPLLLLDAILDFLNRHRGMTESSHTFIITKVVWRASKDLIANHEAAVRTALRRRLLEDLENERTSKERG